MLNLISLKKGNLDCLVKVEDTQIVRDAYARYRRADKKHLWQVYGRWSDAKQDAWEECFKECEDNNGEDFRIISHNQNEFTCGYVFEKDGTKYFRYHTARHERTMEIKH